MNEQLATSPDDARDQVPLSIQSREALTPLVRAMVRVIAKQSPLAQEEQILGAGTDHIPKSAGPVLLRYYRSEVAPTASRFDSNVETGTASGRLPHSRFAR